MRLIRARRPAAIANYLGYALLALAGLGLLLSCGGEPAREHPTATVAASPPDTRETVDSPIPTAALPTMVIESPLPTATTAMVDTETPVPTTVPATASFESPLPTGTPAALIPVCTARVVQAFPHDRSAFTQGLVFEDGALYEGTGRNGLSTLRRVELETGEVLQSISLSPEYFGEGITIWEDRIVQLTWKSGQGFIYDKGSLGLLGGFEYPMEGWGITHDGTWLIMSDGTPTLHFWDPETFTDVRSLEVQGDAGPVTWLNELEYVQGKVLANVWRTDFIAVIDPSTGWVTAWIDLRGLLGPDDLVEPVDVLNGIAYDAGGGRLLVTGKLWPKVFEIELVSPSGAPAPITCR